MLLKKSVLGLRELAPEVSIEDSIKRLGEVFGEKLWEANLAVRKDNSFKFCDISSEDSRENLREKHKKWCPKVIELIKESGKVISFNIECVLFEQLLDVQINTDIIDKDNPESMIFIKAAASVYHFNELSKINPRRVHEYESFIVSVFKNTNIQFINFKVIKLGGKQYSFFTI